MEGPLLKQNRLDYFLISADFEPMIKKADIEISYRSDHSPINLMLQFHNQTRGRVTWTFNNSLLHDKDYVKEIKQCIHDLIIQYSVPNNREEEEIELSINPHLFCEMMKYEIRGKTISYSSYKKRQSKHVEDELITKHEELHPEFENNPNEDIQKDLKSAEESLKYIRERKLRA